VWAKFLFQIAFSHLCVRTHRQHILDPSLKRQSQLHRQALFELDVCELALLGQFQVDFDALLSRSLPKPIRFFNNASGSETQQGFSSERVQISISRASR
jgi:hypothetical protein